MAARAHSSANRFHLPKVPKIRLATIVYRPPLAINVDTRTEAFGLRVDAAAFM